LQPSLLDSTMDPVQSAINNWRKKSLDLSLRSNDLTIPVIIKIFELVHNVLSSSADPILIECSFVSFANQRNISLQYDSLRTDPLRDLFYDLFDAFHLVLDRLNAKNQDYSNQTQVST
ncbi:hypothetical protein PFISCL1PPCAC_11563, partial [Pristionchus fissidentatus]